MRPGLNHISIGKITAVYGLHGELVLQHALGSKDLEGLEKIFVKEKSGKLLPWFVEKVRPKAGEEVYLKLEDIATPEAARLLLQKEVWLDETDFKRYASKSSPISLLGYTVKDGKQVLGTILEVIEQPHQALCRLQVKGKDVFIPLHQETLKKVDHQYKNITVQLPEGLLDVYLGPAV